jgi:hypothetical protein
VLSGGRMKAGGVKFADTPDKPRYAEDILKLPIRTCSSSASSSREKQRCRSTTPPSPTTDAPSACHHLLRHGRHRYRRVAEQHLEHLADALLRAAAVLRLLRRPLPPTSVLPTDLSALTRLWPLRFFLDRDITPPDQPDRQTGGRAYGRAGLPRGLEQEAQHSTSTYSRTWAVGDEAPGARPPLRDGSGAHRWPTRGVGRLPSSMATSAWITAPGGSLTFDAVRGLRQAETARSAEPVVSRRPTHEVDRLPAEREEDRGAMNGSQHPRGHRRARRGEGCIGRASTRREDRPLPHPGSWEGEGFATRKYGVPYVDRTVSMDVRRVSRRNMKKA